MRRKIKGRWAFTCDECQATLETDDEELGSADNFAKQQGWANVKREQLPHHIVLRVDSLNSGKFANLCDNCLENLD